MNTENFFNLNSDKLFGFELATMSNPYRFIGSETKRTLDNDFALCHIRGEIKDGYSSSFLKKIVFIIAVEGTLEVDIKGTTKELKSGTILYSTCGESLKLVSGNKLNLYVLTFSQFFFDSLHSDIPGLCINTYMSYFTCLISDKILLRINQLLLLMEDEISVNNGYYSREIMHNLVSVLYLDVLNMYARKASLLSTENYSSETVRATNLCKDFVKLVKLHTPEHKLVGFYAEKLFISPKYLSTLLKKTTGKTANDWINDAVVSKAKQMLQKSGNNVKEISYALNFPNPSFFGKYFKRHVGVTPLDYQKAILDFSKKSSTSINEAY